MTEPYSYIDPQDHRVQVLTATDAVRRPYVWLQSENLAMGGDMVSVWLPTVQARALARALDARAAFEFTDHTGDTLTVGPSADDWTPFTFTRAPRDDDEEASTVRVVVLTARLPEVSSALTAAADRAEQQAAPKQCEQHPHAPRVDDMCGGCTQYPADMTPAPRVHVNRSNVCGYCELPGHASADCPSRPTRAGDCTHESWDVTGEHRTAEGWHKTRKCNDCAEHLPPIVEAEPHWDIQPAAPVDDAAPLRRVLTEAEYDAAYAATRYALGVHAQRIGRDAIDDAITATLATVGILTPPPEPDADTCPALFADLAGEWHQCTNDPGHDTADEHDNGEWSWPHGETQARPEDDAEGEAR